ncbi:MAG: hypothetical protein IJY79_03750 [Clostridia bacterium]|nr:hypothetical protein [Clostridia bacterium]
MKKAKNILLLTGICLYVIYVLVDVFVKPPQVNLESMAGVGSLLNIILLCVLSIILLVGFPIVLLCLNLKNTQNRALNKIVVALSIISSVFTIVSPFMNHYPKYLLMNELGLINIYLCGFLNFLLDGGILCFVGAILILIGAILSIKKENNKEEA